MIRGGFMSTSRLRRSASSIVAASLVAGGAASAVFLGGVVAAHADPAPIGQPSASTVTADALPTVQIDGVAWSQVVVGNTVYVGGSFSNARPAGAAAGTNLTPRANLLAFDLTTGALITSFVANTNGQVNALAASPDGSRIYAVGTFTSVNGTTRYRIAALNPTTGAVIAGFAPSVNGAIDSVTASNTSVYIGGNFTAIGSSTTR